jgi:hypothetical protein
MSSAFDDVVEQTARAFHATYEALAPSFGWETQESTRAKPWEAVPEHNRRLMLATIRELIEQGAIDPGPAVAPPEEVRQDAGMLTVDVRPGRFTSVPTSIEAMPYTEETRADVEAWLTAAGAVWWPSPHRADRIMLMTPQSSKPVDPGDWVVRGVVGEFYPVGDNVFRMRYRSVE